jgi:hypothetical protein
MWGRAICFVRLSSPGSLRLRRRDRRKTHYERSIPFVFPWGISAHPSHPWSNLPLVPAPSCRKHRGLKLVQVARRSGCYDLLPAGGNGMRFATVPGGGHGCRAPIVGSPGRLTTDTDGPRHVACRRQQRKRTGTSRRARCGAVSRGRMTSDSCHEMSTLQSGRRCARG